MLQRKNITIEKGQLPTPKASARMKTFVTHGINGLPFWDVCCDHGYIGIHALRSKRFSEVHFVDQIPHIMQRLQALFLQSSNLRPDYRYAFHTSAGEDIEHKISGTFLVAGVGGTTIKNILQALMCKNLFFADRLLLSPHLDESFMVALMESESFKTKYHLVEIKSITEGSRQRPLYIYDKKI